MVADIRANRIVVLSVLSLSIGCGGEAPNEEEPLGEVQQGLSCYSASDCDELTGPCKYAVCIRLSPLLPGACHSVPRANGTVCNDGNACTQTDQCSAGSCVGSNPCHVHRPGRLPSAREVQPVYWCLLEPDRARWNRVQRRAKLHRW